MRSPPPAAPRATPAAWARAGLGLAIGALPGVGMVVSSWSAELWTVLMAAVALYFISLLVAPWQFRRPMRPGLAWGYDAGVIVATGVLLGLLFTTSALF